VSALDRRPVIIGIGQVNDRTEDLAQAPDACDLMLQAIHRAADDAGHSVLEQLDTLDLVRLFAAPMEGIPQRLAQALPGLRSEPQFVVGHGTTPLLMLSLAANRIAAGEAEICALAGAEACRTDKRRAAQSAAGGKAPEMMQQALEALTSEDCRRHALVTPISLYPLFENAMRARWGQTLAQAQRESGEMWSQFSRTAAGNEAAWIRREYTPQQIIEPGPGNRPLSFPYTTLMVANNGVNQGAALIVASYAAAKRLGIPEDRMAFIGRSAAATESHDIREREGYATSPSMQAALRAALERNGLRAADCDLLEIYSCFPCVPKYARRVLEIPPHRPLSVSGGLTFAGAPIRNYMMHAAAEMTRRIREDGDRHGLLFANGGFMTEAHAIALSREPLSAARLPADFDAQADADKLRGPIPAFVRDYAGDAQIETYSVAYGPDGAPSRGTIIARTPAGERLFARAQGSELLHWLTSGDEEPVGRHGTVRFAADGLAEWMREG
jgi:acetyl-CoA C-acetyltransferase